jgi:RHS repeat-associated protein
VNDSGELESTTYAYDPLDRTASKTAGGETIDYTYLGLSGEVLGEEVAGQLTKSYQYSPWGQRLSQITHQADSEAGIEAGESAYYGYNSHTDVETLTNDAGNAIATYGYTAYGNADEAEYTGIDKPEAGAPEDAEPYNAYRYNSKRWDAASGTYDMGFRDYSPGLNRFTTRDMYNGALANMSLGSDPYTGNRYAFTAGNPISRVEMDGHFSLSDVGDAWESVGDWVEGAVDDAVSWATENPDDAIMMAGETVAGLAADVAPNPTTMALNQQMTVASNAHIFASEGVVEGGVQVGIKTAINLAASAVSAIPAIGEGAGAVAKPAATAVARPVAGAVSSRVLFGQARVGPKFSPQGIFSGRTIRSVADDLVAGVQSNGRPFTADDLPIEAFRHGDDLVTVNNRSLTALSMAGQRPTNISIVSPSSKLLARLREIPVVGGQLPSTSIAITPSQGNRTIMEIVNIP